MQAGIDRDKADLARMKADLDRAESLYKEKLMAKQEFDQRKFTYEAQQSAVKRVRGTADPGESPARADGGPTAHPPSGA